MNCAITTSWDDGSKLDLRMARLLDRYNLKGTFYIPQKAPFKELTDQEIIELSRHHEIGAHTLNHIDLSQADRSKVEEEVFGSKEYISRVIKKDPEMFCYPKGQYNESVKGIVKEAGFLGSRTTEEFCFGGSDFFQLGTALHVYPFPLRKKSAKSYHISPFLFQPFQKKRSKIMSLHLPFSSFLSWVNLAKNLFDHVRSSGGVYHLWGHSWEVERYDMWNELEEVFKYISLESDIVRLINCQAVRFIYENNISSRRSSS